MAWFVGTQLKSKDSQQRVEAVARLADSRTPQAVGAVFNALGDSAPEVRLQALRVTIGWRDPNTLRALNHVLRDPDASIREQAIIELGKMGARDCVVSILPFLCDSAMPVRTAAVNALSLLGWSAETAGEKALECIGRSQFGKAAMLGRVALELLVAFVGHPVVSTRQEVAEALGLIHDSQAAAALQKMLADPDPGVRIAALQSLARVQPSVAALSAMLGDADKNVRIAAAEALGVLRDNEAVPMLSSCLQDAHWGVRCAAATALALLGERSTVPLLIDSLRDSDPDMRVAAADALGIIGDVEAIEPLVLAQLDLETPVRQAALKAVVRVDYRWYRNPRAFKTLPALRIALRSENYAVRTAATELMERIFGIRRFALRNASPDVEADRRAQSAEVLITCLWDDQPFLAGAAAEMLGHLRSRRASEVLKVKAQDEDPWIRKHAACALSVIEGEESTAGWRPASTT